MKRITDMEKEEKRLSMQEMNELSDEARIQYLLKLVNEKAVPANREERSELADLFEEHENWLKKKFAAVKRRETVIYMLCLVNFLMFSTWLFLSGLISGMWK